MKVSELKKILSDVSDNTELEFYLEKITFKEKIDEMICTSTIDFENLEYVGYDCGYGDSVFVIFLEKAALGE